MRKDRKAPQGPTEAGEVLFVDVDQEKCRNQRLGNRGHPVIHVVIAVVQCVCVCVFTLYLFCIQGLGLLINLVEYSARNKYCLMEMVMEEGQVPVDTTVLSPPNGDGDGDGSSGPLCAIAALVQVCANPSAPTTPQNKSPCRLRSSMSSRALLCVHPVFHPEGAGRCPGRGADRRPHQGGAETSAGPEWRVAGDGRRDPVGRQRQQRRQQARRRQGEAEGRRGRGAGSQQR